jgi:intein/homing endonuclease
MFLIEEGHADVVKWSEKTMRTAKQTFRIPEIIRIFRYVKAYGRALKYSNRFVWERDDYTCFVPNTLILMANGDLKTISKIMVGDKIIDAFGATAEVINVFKKQHSGSVYRIRRRCIGDELVLTPEHKIFACSRNGEFDTEGVPVEKFLLDQDKATSTTRREHLFEPSLCGIIDESNDTIDILEECAPFLKSIVVRDFGKKVKVGFGPGHSVNRFVKRDYDLGRLFGYFLSEGCVKPYRCTTNFTFNISEDRLVNDVIKIIKSKFGLECSVRRNKHRHTVVVFCCNILLNTVFRKLMDEHREKRFSEKRFPREFLKGVLIGTLLGDAAFQEEFKKCSLGMGNEMLVRDMYIVALSINIFPCLSSTIFRDGKKPAKCLIFQGDSWNVISKLAQPFINRELPANEHPSSDRMFANGLSMTRVSKFSSENYSGDVFDLETSGSHSYIAGFTAVHNCQYCGIKIVTKADLTTDHVFPESKGGRTVYENMVTCCRSCNSKKDNKTCEEAHMFPVRKPFRPPMSRNMSKVADEARRILALMDKQTYGI